MKQLRGRSRPLLLAGAAALALAAPSSAAALQSAAASSVQRRYDIPAQPLGDALRLFARQSDRELLFSSEVVAGRRSPGLSGSHDAETALRRLLRGTGLGFTRAPDGAYLISAAPSGEGEAGGAAADDGSAEQGGVAEILVVGTRSQNVDIRRTENDAQPYVVFNREEIQRSQATNLEEFFRTRLPQNTQMQSDATGGGDVGSSIVALGNSSQINLRGLGTNQTLILVDGRRLPRAVSSSAADFTQGDLNGIPLSSIERIEVLPSTAGGIYGGGAVGGVINVIRRRDYRGIDLRASYQGTFRGGGESYQFDASGGFSPNGGRTQIAFSGSWSDARPLYTGDNELWRFGRDLLFSSQAVPSLIPGYTSNILASTNLVLDNGTPLNTRIAYVPVGYAGSLATGDGGAALVATAGRYNLELSNDTIGRRASLRSNPRVRSGNLNLRHRFFTWLDAFADFTYGENLARSTYSGLAGQVTVAANAPNNPFRQDILVLYPLTGTEQSARIETESLSTTAGFIVRPADGWSATVEYGFSRFTTRIDALSGAPTTTAISAAIRNGSVDVLRDLNRYPLDLSAFLPLKPTRSPIETRQQTVSARVAGRLFELPAGAVTTTALLERRVEVAAPTQTVSATNFNFRPERSQANDAAYAEILVPIVSQRNAMPLLRSLDLQLSVRHDRYRTRSTDPADANLPPANPQLPVFREVENAFSSTDFTAAVRWSPVRDVALRASYGTGFLPASIAQLIATERTASIQLFSDPRRGDALNVFRSYTTRTGGDVGLLPEQSKSLSLGVIVTPSFLSGFRFSADYTSIRKTDEIVAPAEQDIVSNEDIFPGRVVRGPNLPGDPAGWAGPITFIDRTLINFARSRIESVDLQADYEFTTGRFGTFHAYALATHQLRLRRQLIPTSAAYDLVDAYEGPLRWRGNAGLDWRLGGWRVGWNMQFYASYGLRYAAPSLATLNANTILLNGGRERVPSQAYHDVYLGYDFPPGHPLAGTRVSLGIQNLFDRLPPVIAAQINGYSRYGDPRLRRFTLSLSKSF